ncbi:MAG: hypothetical protein ABI880_00395 [Acidobacteriota bacterium]
MRLVLLATAIVCVAAPAAAQSHEPVAATHAPAPAPVKPAASDAGHTGPAETGQAAAPAPAHAEASASPKPRTAKVPVVSRITATPKPSAAPTEGAADGEAKRPRVLVSGATPAMATTAESAAHAAAPAASPTAPPRAVNPRAPVKLEAVHGRLAAALAGFRAESKGAKPNVEPDEPGATSLGGPRPHRDPPQTGPRYLISWPEVRWRVNWPDDLTRVAVSWPE